MKKTILIAAVMFLALSVSAFAQTAFTVSQETFDRVACCGLSEETGAIVFTTVAGSPASITGTITLRYSKPITNPGSFNGLTGTGNTTVRVTATDGAGNLLATQPTFNTVDNQLVVIGVPAGYIDPSIIRVFNVRVNVEDLCGVTQGAVTATGSSTGNTLTIGETDLITVVHGVAQPLKTPVVTVAPVVSPARVNIDGSTGAVTGVATIRIDENFITAFGQTGVFQEPPTFRTQNTLIRLTVNTIPPFVSITFPGVAGIFSTASSAGAPSGADVTLTNLSTPKVVYYVMNAASNPIATDALTFSPTIEVDESGNFPLIPSSITISAAFAPITTTATVVPRFTNNCETAAVEFANVAGARNTVLLVPYATTEVGYDTALAVANTTMDPGTVAMGNYLQAISQSGKITIYFFPKDGSTIDPWVSTDHDGEFGLDAAGLLPAGATFVGLLSQLLPESVEEFGGYIFIVTDFTNAHGEFFVSNFDFFTHGALMLVVNEGSLAGRTAEKGLDN
jgi:hypothetical protein